MPDIYFFESRESGVPDSYATLHIPDAGAFPAIPFQWDGKFASPSVVESQRERQQPGRSLKPKRVFPAMMVGIRGEQEQDILADRGPGCVYIVWVEERNEWVAFQETCTHGRTR
jgi:hypothetical protein